MMQVGTSSTTTVSTSALLAMTRFCVFGRSVNCFSVTSVFVSGLWWGGGLGMAAAALQRGGWGLRL